MAYKLKLSSVLRDGGAALAEGRLIGQSGSVQSLTALRYRQGERVSFIGAALKPRFLDWLTENRLQAHSLKELKRLGHIVAHPHDWLHLYAVETLDVQRMLSAQAYGRSVWLQQSERALAALADIPARDLEAIEARRAQDSARAPDALLTTPCAHPWDFASAWNAADAAPHGRDHNGEPILYALTYTHCGETWRDNYSCACNDKCPQCGAEIEPSEVRDLSTGEAFSDGMELL